MEEKLNAILEKLEQINERLEALEEQMDEWENAAMAEREHILSEVQMITPLVQDICTFQRLDFPRYEQENLIFLHTDAMRTASFVNSIARADGVRNTVGQHIAPDAFSWVVALGGNIVVDGDIFAVSPEYEKLIAETMARKTAYFIIVTRDLDTVPQIFRDQMRVIQ